MRGSRIFNTLIGMPFGPIDLLFLCDYSIEDTSLGTVGDIKKLLLLGGFRYLCAEFEFLGMLLVIFLATLRR